MKAQPLRHESQNGSDYYHLAESMQNLVAKTLEEITSSGEWSSDRVAQSFTKDKYVTDMYSFANSEHSVLLQVSSHKTARDIEPIVEKINPTYQSEKEVLSLNGTRYRLEGIEEETGLGMRNRKRTVVNLSEI